jgi:hypothetical protein
MRGMPAPPAVSIVLLPSRIACAAIALEALGTFAVLLTLPVSPWMLCAAACALAAWAADRIRVIGLRRGPRAVRAIRLDGSDRVAVTLGDGRVLPGTLQATSRAGSRLTSVVWRPKGARIARSLLILPDMLPADEFRRFRVLMRYGRSDDSEDEPASHACASTSMPLSAFDCAAIR